MPLSEHCTTSSALDHQLLILSRDCRSFVLLPARKSLSVSLASHDRLLLYSAAGQSTDHWLLIWILQSLESMNWWLESLLLPRAHRPPSKSHCSPPTTPTPSSRSPMAPSSPPTRSFKPPNFPLPQSRPFPSLRGPSQSKNSRRSALRARSNRLPSPLPQSRPIRGPRRLRRHSTGPPRIRTSFPRSMS